MQVQSKHSVMVDYENAANPVLRIVPKALEISQMNFFSDDKEMPMESMLAVSMVNMQLDQVKKRMKPITLPFATFMNPDELSCLGIAIEQPRLTFFNKFITLDAGYQKVDPVDRCEEIEEKLKQKLVEQL